MLDVAHHLHRNLSGHRSGVKVMNRALVISQVTQPRATRKPMGMAMGRARSSCRAGQQLDKCHVICGAAVSCTTVQRLTYYMYVLVGALVGAVW